jgi:hypothetical protein
MVFLYHEAAKTRNFKQGFIPGGRMTGRHGEDLLKYYLALSGRKQ